MLLGDSESTRYEETLEKRCKEDKNEEKCDDYDSQDQCVSQAKNKCNLEASCKGITHQSKNDGKVKYCYSSELESKDDWNSYMKSGPGKFQFPKTSFV